MTLFSAPSAPDTPETISIAQTVSKWVGKPFKALMTGSDIPIDQLLRDLTLPTDYQAILVPIVQSQNYALEQVEVEYYGQKHGYTLLSKAEEKRCLLCLPDRVLSSSSRENMNALGGIKDAFLTEYGKGITLCLFHENDPHVAIWNFIINSWSQVFDVNAILIPLKHLRQVKDMAGSPRTISEIVFKYLGITLTRTVINQKSVADLVENQDEREKIVTMIANAAANPAGLTPQGYLHDLISRTNWPEAWKTELSGFWEGNVDATARKLVNYALSKKVNPENQSYTTIGGLLEDLIRDVDGEERKDLFKMIQDYALIKDKDAILKIKEKYLP